MVGANLLFRSFGLGFSVAFMDPTVHLLVSTAHSGSVYPLDSVRERRQSSDSDLSGAVGGQSLLESSDSWFEALGRIPL